MPTPKQETRDNGNNSTKPRKPPARPKMVGGPATKGISFFLIFLYRYSAMIIATLVFIYLTRRIGDFFYGR